MTILRSRPIAGQAIALANSGVDRALREWEQKVKNAREEGRKAGLAEAQARIAAAEKRAADAERVAAERGQQREQAFLDRFEPVLTSLAGASGRLDLLEKQLIAESEAEAVRLGLAVAAAVLRCTIERDPAWMDALVKRALQEVPDRRQVVVRMHPTDAGHLRGRIAAISAKVPGVERIDIVDDTGLSRGSCILQSQGTRLDISLDSCWKRLADRMLDNAPTSDCRVLVRPGDGVPPAVDEPEDEK
jgi:flagellar biosynthesis/type III secretory pathway protein FliH